MDRMEMILDYIRSQRLLMNNLVSVLDGRVMDADAAIDFSVGIEDDADRLEFLTAYRAHDWKTVTDFLSDSTVEEGRKREMPRPTHYTSRSGGDWKMWPPKDSKMDAHAHTTMIHAIKFADGMILDVVNGWRVPIQRS